MKYSNTKALTSRVLVLLALATAALAGFTGIAEAATCATCHAPKDQTTPDYRPVEHATVYRNITTGAIKGSHAKHIPAATTSVATCTPCHAGAGTYTTSHRTGFVNVTSNTSRSLTYSKTSKFVQAGTSAPVTLGTCATTYCHSSGQAVPVFVTTPAWGTAATLNCNGCHGGPVALGSNILATGKHGAHINGGTLASFGCVECHSKTVSSDTVVSTPANHLNSLMNYSGVKAGKSSTYAGGNCSATYCHTDGKGTQKSMAAALWTGAATMTCTGCHGSDVTNAFVPTAAGEPNYTNAAAPKQNSHQKHTTTGVGSCVNCHGTTVNAAAAILAGGIHLNKTIDVVQGGTATLTYVAGTKTCSTNNCHSGGGIVAGVAAATWGATLNCNGCHGGPVALGSNILATGKHGAHINGGTLASFGCVECHSKTVSSDTVVSTPANHLNSLMNYSGVKAGKSSTYAGGNCSATYCHTDGKGTQKSMAAALWTGAATMTCTGCHGSDVTNAFVPTAAGEPNYTNAAAPKQNSHQKHTTTGVGSCVNCHGTTVDAAATILAGGIHLNKTIDVVQGGTATLTYVAGTKTCSTNNCHSGGGIVAGVAAATWGATLNCNGCHGGPVALGSNILATGKHGAHINGGTLASFGCVECHSKTVSSDTVVSTPANHLNSLMNYSGVKAGKSSTYAGGNCSATYCHTDGKGTQKSMAAALWTGAATMTCTGCHGSDVTNAFVPTAAGEPNYTNAGAGLAKANSHQAHTSAGVSSCVSCHGTTVNAAAAILAGGIHIDKAITVVQGGTATLTYVAGTKTCSTSSCHGSSSIVWGANTTNATCTKCHGTGTVTVSASNYEVVAPSGANSDTGQVSTGTIGAHQTHLKYFNGLSAQGADPQARCQICHTIPGSASHANADSLPVFTGLAKGPDGTSYVTSYSAGTCAVYCHNPTGTGGVFAAGNAPAVTTVSWTDAAYIAEGTLKTQTNCNKCHKVPGDAGFTFAAEHGSMTTTTAPANNCIDCHGHEGGVGGAVGQQHMDGIRYAASSSCDGCHNYDTEGVAPNKTWGSKNKNYSGYVGVNEANGAHAKHIEYLKTRWALPATLDAAADNTVGYGAGNAAKICGTCHTNVLGNHKTGDRMINFGDGTQTVNGTPMTFGSAPVAVYNGAYGVSSAITAKTCSNLSCHYFTTPLWSTY